MMPPLFAGLSPREKLFRSLFMFALLLVTTLSLIPNPDDVPGGMDFTRWLASLLFGDATHSDKVAHFIAYGILGGGIILGAVRLLGSFIVCAIGIITWSGVLEILQGIISSRSTDPLDMVANASGVGAGLVAGILLLWIGLRVKKKRHIARAS